MLNLYEIKYRELENEKKVLEVKNKADVEETRSVLKAEADALQAQCTKYKYELTELTEFSARKVELEQQLREYKSTLEKREIEYKDTVHNLERRVLQDKNRMKREMLQKLNEAVANFRRVADQQMAETTKRAIRENMAITTQIKKMSSKIIELVAENETLSDKLSKITLSNSLLVQSEKELIKRNYANQKVIKMLVERLKEGDQMLEMAFEAEQAVKDADAGNQYEQNQNNILTDEMKEEIEALQYDYNVLAARLAEIVSTCNEFEMILTETSDAVKSQQPAGDVLEYVQTNMNIICARLKALTHFETAQEEYLEAVSPIDEMEEESLFREQSIDDILEQEEEQEEEQDEEQDEQQDEEQYQQDSREQESIEGNVFNDGTDRSELKDAIDSDHDVPARNLDSRSKFRDSTQVQASQNVQTYNKQKRPKPKSMFDKVDEQFKAILGLPLEEDECGRTIGTQTDTLTIDSNPGRYLLGDVRPWGVRAESLPRHGLGAFTARSKKQLSIGTLTSTYPVGKPLRQ